MVSKKAKRHQEHQRRVWDILLICANSRPPGAQLTGNGFVFSMPISGSHHSAHGNIVDRMNQRLPWQVWRNKKSEQEMLGLIWVGRDPVKNNLLKPLRAKKSDNLSLQVIVFCLCEKNIAFFPVEKKLWLSQVVRKRQYLKTGHFSEGGALENQF